MKQFLVFGAMLLLIAACSDNENENPCETPDVYVQINSSGNSIVVGHQNTTAHYGFVELEYGPNGFTTGTGTLLTVTPSYVIDSLAISTYDIYMRGNCGGTSWSDWSSVVSFIIQ